MAIAFGVFIVLEFGLVSVYIYFALAKAGRSAGERWGSIGVFWLWTVLAVGMLWWLGWYCNFDVRNLTSSQYVPFGVGLAVAVFAVVQVFRTVNKASRLAGLRK